MVSRLQVIYTVSGYLVQIGETNVFVSDVNACGMDFKLECSEVV